MVPISKWIPKEEIMLKDFRCKFCHRLLAKVEEGSKVEIKCPKCKTLNLYQDETVIVYEIPENNVTKKIIEKGIVKYDLLKN
jgi:phage FluMu protein Com